MLTFDLTLVVLVCNIMLHGELEETVLDDMHDFLISIYIVYL